MELIENLDDEDIEEKVKIWCEENNHDYNNYDENREYGVYNMNILDIDVNAGMFFFVCTCFCYAMVFSS